MMKGESGMVLISILCRDLGSHDPSFGEAGGEGAYLQPHESGTNRFVEAEGQ